MLVALVPLITMAQKRSKKTNDNKTESKANYEFMTIKGLVSIPLEYKKQMERDRSSSQMTMTDGIGSEATEHAQKIRYEFFRVTLDFGNQATKEEQNLSYKLSNSLHSMTDAVNMLANYGWDFVGSDIWSEDNTTYYHYYMIKK